MIFEPSAPSPSTQLDAAKPLDAPTAFALLFRHWFDNPEEAASQHRSHAKDVEGAYVADILALWDVNARTWLRNSPAIIRLETCDVAVFPMVNPCIALFVGALETEAPLSASKASKLVPSRNEISSAQHESTFQWANFSPCSYAIGRQVERMVFEENPSGQLVAASLILDDGGSLRIDASGIDCWKADASSIKHLCPEQGEGRSATWHSRTAPHTAPSQVREPQPAYAL